jgi:hypothetical protein
MATFVGVTVDHSSQVDLRSAKIKWPITGEKFLDEFFRFVARYLGTYNSRSGSGNHRTEEEA